MQQHAFWLLCVRILWRSYNVVFGFIVQGIDMAAHLGGLAGGFVCGMRVDAFAHFRAAGVRGGVLVGVIGLGLIIG